MHNSDICAQVIFINKQPVPNIIWNVIKLVIVLTKQLKLPPLFS